MVVNGCTRVRQIDPTGKVVRYKARLVAQGYGQKKNVDYFETYAPVANMSTIRLLLAMSICEGWQTHHLDLKCVYLYGELTEEIYMKLPPGYSEVDTKVGKTEGTPLWAKTVRSELE